MALVFIRSVCFATKAFNSSLFAKSAAKDSLICAFRSRLSSDWLSLYAFSKRSLRVSGGDSFVGDYCSVVLTTRLVEYSKKSQKILDEQMFVCYNKSNSLWVYVSRHKKRRCRVWRYCPIVRSLSGNRIGRITVVYHRVAIKCSISATGVEIVKKERFQRGFYCDTIF